MTPNKFSQNPIEQRRAAWAAVDRFYCESIRRFGFGELGILLDLVRALHDSPQGCRFHPGTSHYALLISIADYYRINARERFIAVTPFNEQGHVRVLYCKGHGAQKEVARAATTREAIQILDPLLRRLWSDMAVVPNRGPNKRINRSAHS